MQQHILIAIGAVVHVVDIDQEQRSKYSVQEQEVPGTVDCEAATATVYVMVVAAMIQ